MAKILKGHLKHITKYRHTFTTNRLSTPWLTKQLRKCLKSLEKCEDMPNVPFFSSLELFSLHVYFVCEGVCTAWYWCQGQKKTWSQSSLSTMRGSGSKLKCSDLVLGACAGSVVFLGDATSFPTSSSWRWKKGKPTHQARWWQWG